MRPKALEVIARQRAEDAMWGIPESPEFSSVQRLMNEFQSHASHEERSLSSYKEITNESSDPLIRFLLGLIVTDEQRHHELTSRMISKLKNELARTRAEGLSRRVYGEVGKRTQLLLSVERFLEAERKGIQEYERLRKQSQGLYRDVFALLYTTMIHDSHKHIGILEFLQRKLTENRELPRKRKTFHKRSAAKPPSTER
jgi:rubrerythrin